MENDNIFYKSVRRVIKAIFFMYCKIVYRVKIIGTENIPKKGTVLFCANHKTFFDPIVVAVTCKRDDTRFIAKIELTKNPILKFLAKVFNVILVKRNDKEFS